MTVLSHRPVSKTPKETTDVKRKCRYLMLLSLLLLFCIPYAAAEGSATVGMGFGSMHVKANGSGIDNSTGEICSPGASNPSCEANPSLGGFFMGFGADALPWEHFGFGFSISFQPAKGDYGILKYRQTFYDFNGIFAPVNTKRAVLKLMGGIGGAKTSSSYESTSCIGSFCSGQTYPWASSNHFQMHAGVGVEIYVTEHMFIRPQFDYRYVRNFNDFGSNHVPGGMIWIGFRTGGN